MIVSFYNWCKEQRTKMAANSIFKTSAKTVIHQSSELLMVFGAIISLNCTLVALLDPDLIIRVSQAVKLKLQCTKTKSEEKNYMTLAWNLCDLELMLLQLQFNNWLLKLLCCSIEPTSYFNLNSAQSWHESHYTVHLKINPSYCTLVLHI